MSDVYKEEALEERFCHSKKIKKPFFIIDINTLFIV